MSRANDLAEFAAVAGEMAGRNRIINGGFDIWQRGTSFTATGYTADRWRMALGSGAAATLSRQAFTVGQTDVAGEPQYFLRLNRTTTGSTATTLEQRMEGVRTFAGQEITVSFDAKAGSAITLNTILSQDFGTGGSPSSDVDSSSEGHSLTTSWQRFTRTLTLASISGKTLGSNGDDYLGLIFELPTGASTVAIDVANVQVEVGGGATPFENRQTMVERALCQRYFEKSYNLDTTPAEGTGGQHIIAAAFSTAQVRAFVPFRTSKRTDPTVTLYRPSDIASPDGEWAYYSSGWTAPSAAATTAVRLEELGFNVNINESAAFTDGNAYMISGNWTADAEL